MSDVAMPPGGELILYTTEDGRTRVECRFEQDTIWLTQRDHNRGSALRPLRERGTAEQRKHLQP